MEEALDLSSDRILNNNNNSYVTVDCESLTLLVHTGHGFDLKAIRVTMNCG